MTNKKRTKIRRGNLRNNIINNIENGLNTDFFIMQAVFFYCVFFI